MPRPSSFGVFSFGGREYVALTAAVMLSGLSAATLRRFAKRGRIGVLATPTGCLYAVEDLARLAADSPPPQAAAAEEPGAAEEAAS